MGRQLLLLLLFINILLSAQDSKWPKVDASNLDAITYPLDAAWRNYLEGEKRTLQPQVKVVYSRPLKNGREIFGNLVPFGKEWRFGANEATTITFYQSVAIGLTTVPAGTYTMFADVTQDFWTIKISSQTGTWGGENRDISKNIASIKLPVLKLDKVQEFLSMTFQEENPLACNLVIEWDKSRVYLPIGFNPVEFEELDKSPMDIAHFPSKSAYTNYLEGDEKKITPMVQVLYSRPYKNGRKIFGELIKYGDIWRVGANQSTEIVFYQDTKFGGTDVKKGRYAMYAIVNSDSWDIILSKDYPAWGSDNRDKSKDVHTIKVPVSTESEMLENLSIIFDEKPDGKSGSMIIGWDTTRATVSISVK